MKGNSIEIAAKLLELAIAYPLEVRIAKYLFKAGHRAKETNVHHELSKAIPTLSQPALLRVYNAMRDIENGFIDPNKIPDVL